MGPSRFFKELSGHFGPQEDPGDISQGPVWTCDDIVEGPRTCSELASVTFVTDPPWAPEMV